MSQYCSPADVGTYALPSTALLTITPADQTAICIAASEEADSYLRGRYNLPLLSFGTDLVRYVSYIAAYLMLSKRGFQPQLGADKMILENYYRAVGFPGQPASGWFGQVLRRSLTPDITDTPAAAPKFQLPQVASGTPRGW